MLLLKLVFIILVLYCEEAKIMLCLTEFQTRILEKFRLTLLIVYLKRYISRLLKKTFE